MDYRPLGRTGLVVSRLGFGSLSLTPPHGLADPSSGIALLEEALDRGVNLIDTAEIYENYYLLRRALARRRDGVVVATKSYAYTRTDMEHSLVRALRELNRPYIDIFLLHEQESALTLRGHYEALAYLVEARDKGLVRAVGISTHAVAAVEAAADLVEIDVIHPLVNRRGLGIIDGDREAMLAAIERAHRQGKGIYAMKALAGGHLIGEADAALRWAFGLPFVDSVVVGMSCREELEANLAVADGREVPGELKARLGTRTRRLVVEEWCQGCGECVSRCPQQALSLNRGRARVDPERCVLCGYCALACRSFCLKVV
ncbi:MAG: aldo/keto reductase [Clostridia bacterium]|jgi:aryl-alcohol dehydrogenase-like predicted oxidoreductase|nr:aldo/keto reductase [Clostridia bacterium]MDH7572799.1 aldo/keto reductase [Clostridia bacterium]